MEAFYQTVATFSFTLLGLWWGVLQLRHSDWVNDLPKRRMAYSVNLAFLVPGVMSLGAQTAGDIKIIWRLVFIVAGLLGIVAVRVPHPRPPALTPRPAGSRVMDVGSSVLLYAIVVLIAFVPDLSTRSSVPKSSRSRSRACCSP